jgi:sugar O-acyltransferase (sialic acid O-acetyltransferase NeuD family)
VLIIRAGGHAQVVADILLRTGEQDISIQPIGYLDDNPALQGQRFLGLTVLGAIANLSAIAHDAVIVAIGDNRSRQQVYEKLQNQNERFAVARHPSAVIAPDVQLGPGSMICAGVIVNPASLIGANVILNTGCTIDHHNFIGSHAHIAPGVHLGGEVTIGEGALIGIGATVMPRCRVGAWSVVGAGAVVNRDLPDGVTAMGVPAKVIERKYGL